MLTCVIILNAMLALEKLRHAYDSGLKSGLREGLPSACPFAVGHQIDERFAWLSGFSVGKIVRLGKT